MRRTLASLSIAAVVSMGSLGCSEDVSGGAGAAQDALAGADGGGDGQTADGSASDSGGADAGDALDSSAEDSAAADSAVDSAGDDAADVDWSDLLDPEDSTSGDSGSGDVVEPVGPVGQLYAETPDELYRLDLATKAFTKVGKFSFNKNPGEVTDIALDQGGALYAITNDDLFTCTVEAAKCTWLAALPEIFNGMTFVPKGTVSATADTLIGISQDGDWTQITVNGNKVSLKKLGTYGGGWLSSGDAFSVEGIGTYATLKGKGTSDSLASIDPKTGKILKIIGETGAKGLYGLAWWSGVFYGFSSDGNVYVLDVTTAKATVVSGITAPKGVKWWGAGVSTRAAGKVN